MFAAILRSDGTRPEPDDSAASPHCDMLPRSFGAIDLNFHHKDGATRAERVFQLGVMRARFPNVASGAPPEAVLINTAGGLTGGDSLTLSVAMGPGTAAVVTTQAHEKVYRSVLGDVSVTANASLAPGAVLEWLPQPAILFDGARLDRETHIVLAADSVFLGIEAVIFGRTAMKEIMQSGSLTDHWSIRRDGRLIHADRFAVAGDVAALLARPSVLAGHAAMATIRYVAPDAEARLEEMRALIAGDGAATAWNGLLLARIVAVDGYGLGKRLAPLLTAFRGRALPPAWHI